MEISFLFGVLDIIGTLGLGIFAAVLLDRAVSFRSIFRTIMLYPLSISLLSAGLTWQWVLSPTIGVSKWCRRTLAGPAFVFD